MSKKVKKGMAMLLMVCTIVGIGQLNVDAASKSFWCNFNSGSNGRAYVDGSSNGVYYTLNAGRVYMNVSSFSKIGSGNYVNITLKRKQWGIDANYGTVSVGTRGTYSWNVDQYSDQYYLFAMGDGAIITEYTVQGTIYN